MTESGQPHRSEILRTRANAEARPDPSAEAPTGRRRDDHLVAASPSSQRALEVALTAARSELPVLIWGPPGSGKSALARAIHGWSRRAAAPCEMVICAGVPQPLQARELFGCAAGTFPALPEAYNGACERSGRGTLVLEGLEALSAGVREALERALQSRQFRAEGDARDRALEARVLVTTTHADGRLPFGELPHHEIRLHALAERPEDVLPLATHFLAAAAREAGVRAVGFTAEARAALLEEAWPGNAAELRERIRNAVRLARDGALGAEALALAAQDGDHVPSFRDAKRAFETRYVEALLRRCQGNISRAARLAKKDRKDFYDVIRRTGVDPTRFRR